MGKDVGVPSVGAVEGELDGETDVGTIDGADEGTCVGL